MSRRKKSSPIWTCFTVIDNTSKIAQCCICSHKLRFSTTISNLKKHLNRKHPNITLTKTEHDSPSDEVLTDVEFEQVIDDSEENSIEETGRTIDKDKGRSYVWNYFAREFPHKRAKCFYCGAIISFVGGNTGNLFRHLRMKHPEVHVQKPSEQSSSSGNAFYFSQDGTMVSPDETVVKIIEVPSEASGETPTPSSESFSGQEVKHINISSSLSPFIKFKSPPKKDQLSNKSSCDMQLVRLLIKQFLPLKFIKNPELIKFIHHLNPNYALPPFDYISKVLIPCLLNKTKNALKNNLDNSLIVCLFTDTWTSVNGADFVSLCAHYYMPESGFHTSLLGCSSFYGLHTSECSNTSTEKNMSDWLLDVLNEWSITNKVHTITTGGVAIMDSIAETCNLQHTTCFVHGLNHVIEKGISQINSVVSKVDSVIQYISQSFLASQKLKSIKELSKISKHNNFADWKFTYEMLNIFFDNKESILSDMDLLKMNDEFNISSTDWDLLKESLNIFLMFDEVVKDVCNSSTVTVSKIPILSHFVIKQLNNKSRKYSDEIEMMKTICLKEMLKTFGNLETNRLVATAMLLDPRFKQKGFDDNKNYHNACAALKDEVKAVVQLTMTKNKNESLGQKEDSSPLWGFFDNIVKELIVESDPCEVAADEVDKYLSEPLRPRQIDPLQWWTERRVVYPHLFDLAMKYLCLPANCYSCAFPLDKELSERRSMLKSTELSSNIIFLNKNLEQ